jgi:hypothetical protein
MANTPSNQIPYVPENTIDPAAGLNISIDIIDVLLNSRVESMTSNTPPGSPSDAVMYIVGTAPTGAWTGHSRALARWTAEGAYWSFYAAGAQAWLVINKADNTIYSWNATTSDWVAAAGLNDAPSDGTYYLRRNAAWVGFPGILSVEAGTNITIDATDPLHPIINGTSSGSVQSVQAGANITVDDTDPENPIVSGPAPGLHSIVAGTNVTIDNTDPLNPIINASGGGGGGGGSGSYSFVAEQVVTAGATTTLTFSGLDLGTDLQYVLEYSFVPTGGGNKFLYLQYNGDSTATNYRNQGLISKGGTVSGYAQNTSEIISTDASGPVIGTTFIKKSTDGRPVALTKATRDLGAAMATMQTSHYWTSAANVTSLVVVTDTAYTVGDVIRLYKITKAGAAGSSNESIVAAASDETTALTTGLAKLTFRNPYSVPFIVTSVKASLTSAQATGSIFTVDINESGTSILSTKITIDNTEKTSTTAATPPVLSNTSIAADAEITIDIDQVGDGTATGLKVYLIGHT